MNRQILRLALPNILSNISVPMLSAVDTALMGHLSTAHLAALGVSGMIFMFLYSNFGFLRMGTTGMVAQAYGAGEKRDLSLTLYRAFLLALALALPMLLFAEPIFALGSSLMHIESSYYTLAYEYFMIRISTAPAVLGLYVLTGFFFGVQNARYPLYITLLVNLVNLVLTIFLVRTLEWGIAGAAWGTVAAQYAGLLYGFFLLRRSRHRVHAPRWSELFQRTELGRFFHINRNIFIRTAALTFALAFFYAQAAKEGETTLSVMILLMQFMIWMSFAIDGFANAAESLSGRYYGAKDRQGFMRVVRLSLAWGGGLALLFSIIYALFGEEIVALYTNQIDVRNAIRGYMPLVVFLPLIAFPAFIYDGIFIGMTAVRAMRNAVLASTLLYLLSYEIMAKFLPPSWSLWIAFMGFFLFRGVIEYGLFRKKGMELS